MTSPKAYIALITCIFFCSGCIAGGPLVPNLLHEVKSTLVTQALRPANITITAIDDTREVKFTGDSGWLSLYVPLLLYRKLDYQDGPGNSFRSSKYASSLFMPGHEQELSQLLNSYLRKSISLSTRRGEVTPSTDFYIKPVLEEWKQIQYLTWYGLSVLGSALMLIGTPMGKQNWQISYTLNMVDVQTQKTIFSKKYIDTIEGGLIPGVGPISWFWTDYRRSFQFRPERFCGDVKPFIQESMEDFVLNLQKVLPLASDTKYWDNINRARDERVAKVERDRIKLQARRAILNPMQDSHTSGSRTTRPPIQFVLDDNLVVKNLDSKKGVDQQTAEVLSEVLKNTLGEYRSVQSMDALAAVNSLVEEKLKAGCDDTKCIIEVAGAMDIAQVVAGSISKLGSTYMISLMLIQAKGDNLGVIKRASEECQCSEEELIGMTKRVAAKLLQ